MVFHISSLAGEDLLEHRDEIAKTDMLLSEINNELNLGIQTDPKEKRFHCFVCYWLDSVILMIH